MTLIHLFLKIEKQVLFSSHSDTYKDCKGGRGGGLGPVGEGVWGRGY